MQNDFVSVSDLSEWLAAYAMPPQYAISEVLDGRLDVPPAADRSAAAWAFHIRNLIDCGLLDGRGKDKPCESVQQP